MPIKLLSRRSWALVVLITLSTLLSIITLGECVNRAANQGDEKRLSPEKPKRTVQLGRIEVLEVYEYNEFGLPATYLRDKETGLCFFSAFQGVASVPCDKADPKLRQGSKAMPEEKP